MKQLGHLLHYLTLPPPLGGLAFSGDKALLLSPIYQRHQLYHHRRVGRIVVVPSSPIMALLQSSPKAEVPRRVLLLLLLLLLHEGRKQR